MWQRLIPINVSISNVIGLSCNGDALSWQSIIRVHLAVSGCPNYGDRRSQVRCAARFWVDHKWAPMREVVDGR